MIQVVAEKPAQTRVHVLVTPDDLRKLADECERVWRDAGPGSDLVSFSAGADGVLLRMACDQGRMK